MKIEGIGIWGCYKDYLRLEKNTSNWKPVLYVIANFMVEDATGLGTINSSAAVIEF